MTTMRTIVLVCLFVLAFGGCSQNTQSGDFGGYITSEIERLGGRRVGTNALPTLNARWTVRADKSGFEAHLAQMPFNELASYLRQAYGVPNSAGTNEAGREWVLYRALDIGVAIHCYAEGQGCVMNCIRGLK